MSAKLNMKKLIVLAIAAVVILAGCINMEKNAILEDINLQEVGDGKYEGEYTLLPVKVKVLVTVKNHVITDIEIVKHINGKGSKAEVIIDDVIREQSILVDAVTGATVSSRTILKAIEDALNS